MPKWTATERLYLNKDRTKVLREGEPGAASLLCGEGTIVNEDVARLWGLGPFAPTPNAVDTVTDAGPTDTKDDQSDTGFTDPPQNGSTSDSAPATESTPDPSPLEPVPDLTPRRRK